MKANMIKLHSITDLITNSSTVIYTYSENSVNALKLMVNEVFKMFNIDKTCDDVFDTVVMYGDDADYFYAMNEEEGGDASLVPEELKNVDDKFEAVGKIWEKVIKGEIAKPDWMNKIEEYQNDNPPGYGYPPSTRLFLIPKKPEYEALAKSIKNFLYSTSHEACREG